VTHQLEKGRALVLVAPQGSGVLLEARRIAHEHGPYAVIGETDLMCAFQRWMTEDIKTVIVKGPLSRAGWARVESYVVFDTMRVNRKGRDVETLPAPHFIVCTPEPRPANPWADVVNVGA
jgi:hypothetical protein